MANEEIGLIKKYNIEPADGSKPNPDAKYFVLRYDRFMGDKKFLKANRLSLSKFIREIMPTHPKLAEELWDAISDEIIAEAGLIKPSL